TLRQLAFEAVSPLLSDGEPSVRSAAVSILSAAVGSIRSGAPGARSNNVPSALRHSTVELLIPRLGDADQSVRRDVARALARIGDSSGVEALRLGSEAPSPDVRAAAVDGLRQVGGAEVVKVLVSKLSDEDARVRRAAVGALGEVGGPEISSVLMPR